MSEDVNRIGREISLEFDRAGLLESFVRRHELAANDLTEKQLADAIRQALPDFRKVVSSHGQQVVYIPFLEADRWKRLYNELLMEVGTVHDGETRHETALRYIRERENGVGCVESRI